MPLYSLDPLTDRRWDELVETHPNSSIFHRSEWLKTLADTYSYKPVVLTSSAPGTRLSDGIAFCLVKSWITGSRLVSLPFSDHCEPLLGETSNEAEFVEWLLTERKKRNLKYIELRPIDCPIASSSFSIGQSFWIHNLDLTKPIEDLFEGLHKNSLQRRIRKAEREPLEYERGCSDGLLEEFCELMLITRRRHHLLPQPRSWFHNLARNMRPYLDIHIARKEGRAIAALVTLRHRRTVVYKYGCSDERFHHLAGMPFLFWKLIEASKAQQLIELDFGRTDLDNEGLTRFKDQFGTIRKKLAYLRLPKTVKETSASTIASQVPFAGQIFARLPGSVSWRLGGILYRHMG